MDDVQSRLDGAADQLRSIAIGALELLVAVALASLVVRWLRRRLAPRIDEIPSGSAAVLLQNAITGCVYVVFATVLLAFWGLTWSSLVTALSISTVAVAFGFQDALRSIVGGVLVVFEKPFMPGDRIKVRDVVGKVESVQLRTTTVRSDDGDRIILPNALLFSDPIVNLSPERKRLVIVVSNVRGEPAVLRQNTLDAMTLVDANGRFEISVKTHRKRNKVRRAIHTIPGVGQSDTSTSPESVGFGLRIRWYGDSGKEQLDQAIRALTEAFPGCQAKGEAWY